MRLLVNLYLWYLYFFSVFNIAYYLSVSLTFKFDEPFLVHWYIQYLIHTYYFSVFNIAYYL